MIDEKLKKDFVSWVYEKKRQVEEELKIFSFDEDEGKLILLDDMILSWPEIFEDKTEL